MMNNKELAWKIRELIAWQNKSACGFSCCSDCDCWNEEFECLNNGCSILIQAADALEKASDFEKVLADFAKIVNAGFQAMAEQKENKPKWISVKDRLPEAGGYVVCIAKRNPFSRFMPMAARIEKNGWVNPITEQYISEVTHWMPIQEPPEEGTT